VALLWMGVRLLATRRCETNCGCANAGDQADSLRLKLVGDDKGARLDGFQFHLLVGS
jgi:hypothetical protein